MFHAETIRIPASAARGMKRAYGAKTSMISATASAETTPDHCVTAPACWLIAERVSEPEPGMHWKKLPVKFASPSLRHCWFMSSFCPVCAAIALAIDDGFEQTEQRDRERAGRERRASARRRAAADGRAAASPGISPTTLTPRWSSPSRATSAAIDADHDQQIGQQAPAEPRLRASAARSPARSCRGRSPPSRRGCRRRPISVSQKRTRKWSWASPIALHAEQVLQLVEHQQHAGADGEADDHRVRDVAGEIAEPAAA